MRYSRQRAAPAVPPVRKAERMSIRSAVIRIGLVCSVLAPLGGCYVAPAPGYYRPAPVYVAPAPVYRPYYGYGYGWHRW